MARRLEVEPGLTAEEIKACQLRVSGMTQADAYRRAFRATKLKPERAQDRASKLFAKPLVAARVTSLLRSSKLLDLDSPGQCIDDLMRVMKKCEEAGNYTAHASYMRMRMQAHALLVEKQHLTVEATQSDAELLKRLAGDDTSKQATLKAILGAPDGFAAAAKPSPKQPECGATKH